MADGILKVIDAFYLAKKVDHYYWLHTDGDDRASTNVNVANIQTIVELMTGFEIETLEVDVQSEFHRAFIERSDRGAKNVIYVMKHEPLFEKRFAIVKELCHILVDGQDDFQVDPCVTIDAVKASAPLFSDGSLTEKDSETLAEIIALELIYPMDMRRKDRENIESGASHKSISEARMIPIRYIYRGCDDYWFEVCKAIWSRLPAPDPKNLNDKLP